MADLKHKDFMLSIENFDIKDSIADEKETQKLIQEKEECKKSRNDFLYILFKRAYCQISLAFLGLKFFSRIRVINI
ncbi:hypothetical protein HpMMM19_07440 [Helicobacter pylori]